MRISGEFEEAAFRGLTMSDIDGQILKITDQGDSIMGSEKESKLIWRDYLALHGLADEDFSVPGRPRLL